MAPLISTAELSAQLHDPQLIIADVRWEHNNLAAARAAYEREHIPGAIFISLDEDLSDLRQKNRGRHPLPDPQAFAAMLAGKGIGKQTTLVVYDDKLGSLAVRLWLMLRWIGAPEPQLLDGGLTKWMAEQRPTETGPEEPRKSGEPFIPHVNRELFVDYRLVETAARDGILLLDARAPERFRGDIEPIDTRGGHIPDAINAPWTENLTESTPQVFKSPAELRVRFEKMGVSDSVSVVNYCGSGVTACVNLFALHLAGFRNARLYPGSWSEWVSVHPENE